jgi:hypothetical protein
MYSPVAINDGVEVEAYKSDSTGAELSGPQAVASIVPRRLWTPKRYWRNGLLEFFAKLLQVEPLPLE